MQHVVSYVEENTINETIEDEDLNGIPVYARTTSTVRKEVEVLSIRDLRKADHLRLARIWGYSHHAIVEDIDISRNLLTLIEYTDRNNFEFFNKFVVKRTTYNYSELTNLNKYIYDVEVDEREVLCRARGLIGTENYNLFFNNCEHFATFCRTGVNVSLQVKDAWNSGFNSLVIGGLVTLTKSFAPAILAEIVEKYSAQTLGVGVAAGATVIEAIYELYKLIKDLHENKISVGVFREYLIILISKYSFSLIGIILAILLTSPASIPTVILTGIFVGFVGMVSKYFGKILGTYINKIRRNWSEIISYFKEKIASAKDAVLTYYESCKDTFISFIKWLLGY